MWSISMLLRDPSNDLENNPEKEFKRRRTVNGKIYTEIYADSANNGIS